MHTHGRSITASNSCGFTYYPVQYRRALIFITIIYFTRGVRKTVKYKQLWSHFMSLCP